MLDIKFVRENPDIVKQNIKNKFQDEKLPLVDEVIALDKKNRDIKQEVEALRANRNKLSKQIGGLMAQGKKDEAEEVKAQVNAQAARLEELNAEERTVEEELRTKMMTIPNIIDPSVPIGKEKMIVKMLRLKSLVNLPFLTSKFLTTLILWKSSRVSTSTAQEEQAVMVSTISAVTLLSFSHVSFHMQETS